MRMSQLRQLKEKLKKIWSNFNWFKCSEKNNTCICGPSASNNRQSFASVPLIFLRSLVFFNRQVLFRHIHSFPSKSFLYFCIEIITVIWYKWTQNTRLPHSSVYFLMDRETEIPKTIQVLQIEKPINSCIKMS